jgi:ABC-type nickel/cobalt efflux system permease component RcnA
MNLNIFKYGLIFADIMSFGMALPIFLIGCAVIVAKEGLFRIFSESRAKVIDHTFVEAFSAICIVSFGAFLLIGNS